MQCKSNSHKTSSAPGLPMTGPPFFFFFFKQSTCKRSAYKLAFQVLGKAMGWPWSRECLAVCWVDFSQGDEL